ncbi:hypothetical protein [Companilactobacillus nuruki]|uniref:Uncharacterized protein n=1 Tax=Companilactobacillus nuruki TaxID=1993540 RepID=A0A2N7AUZ1_9LACO|nr:hypothetical protein [Companilactobacillus nuruki]PMD71472.1 hypothetical protein CBP76_05005 [Companilactobacillus nuruki]
MNFSEKNISSTRSSIELNRLLNDMKNQIGIRQNDVYDRLKHIQDLRFDEDLKIINGYMNQAVKKANMETGYSYKDIARMWITSMFPDMEVK